MSASTSRSTMSGASPQVSRCPMCSKELAAHAVSCPTCGWTLGATPETLARPTAASAARPVNWAMRLRVGGVIGFVALILVCVGWMVWPFLFNDGIRDMGDCFEVDLMKMSSFQMDQTRGTIEDIPRKFRELNGKRVILRGEVTPNASSTRGGMAQFEICYSVAQCCFTGDPQVQHFVLCRMGPNKAAPAFVVGSKPVRVVGTLRINFDRDGQIGGKINSVFQLDVERVDKLW